MWAYASYEPEQEIEEAGIHYTLTSLSKDEWMQTDRLKNVTKYLSCQEGQEVSETLDVETADEVTGEALYGTIGRIELKEDGADWKEGALEGGIFTAGMESLGFIKETMNVLRDRRKSMVLKAMRRYLCRSII